MEKTNESQTPPKPKALQEKVAEAGDVPPAKQESTDTESEDVSKDDDSAGQAGKEKIDKKEDNEDE